MDQLSEALKSILPFLQADAVVIATEWEQFRALDLNRLKAVMMQPVIVDLRNIYRPDEMQRAAFRYVPIGRAGVE